MDELTKFKPVEDVLYNIKLRKFIKELDGTYGKSFMYEVDVAPQGNNFPSDPSVFFASQAVNNLFEAAGFDSDCRDGKFILNKSKTGTLFYTLNNMTTNQWKELDQATKQKAQQAFKKANDGKDELDALFGEITEKMEPEPTQAPEVGQFKAHTELIEIQSVLKDASKKLDALMLKLIK